MILKHPVIVSILSGILTYIVLYCLNKKKKRKKKERKTISERNIIITLIVMLIVWFVMSYNTDKINSDIKKITDSIDVVINNDQTGGTNKSLNVLNSGINIPTEGFATTIPDVLIDYV